MLKMAHSLLEICDGDDGGFVDMIGNKGDDLAHRGEFGFLYVRRNTVRRVSI